MFTFTEGLNSLPGWVGQRRRWFEGRCKVSRQNSTHASGWTNQTQEIISMSRFVESSSGDRIFVKNNGGGCWSSVGHQEKTYQELSLQSGEPQNIKSLWVLPSLNLQVKAKLVYDSVRVRIYFKLVISFEAQNCYEYHILRWVYARWHNWAWVFACNWTLPPPGSLSAF